MKLKLILTTAIVGVALALPGISSAAPAAAASAAAATTTQPTLSLERNCEAFPGFNNVNVELAGLPPFTSFDGTLVLPDGTSVEAMFTTDASGSFEALAPLGTQEPGIFEATVVWSGGTLTQSLFVDCSAPASKEECKKGGWRNFPQFKNQGQCVAFVNHNS
jgi:hypothetical protein